MGRFIDKVFSKVYRKLMRCDLNEKYRRYEKNDDILLGSNVKIYPSTVIEPQRERSIEIGNNTCVRGRLVTFPSGGFISIGSDGFVGDNTQIWSEKKIRIGNHVLIAHNCNIFDYSTHPIDYLERRDHFNKIMQTGFPNKQYSSMKHGEIIIDDDVWIGCNSVILGGVRIGKRSIVSAGSVVIRDVPEHVIVAGNPAKIIKNLNV